MAADRVIQEEYEQWVMLYSQTMEKPKRGSQENVVRLSDDGELPAENSSEDQRSASTSRE
jgi:hypothetical protein